MVMVVRSSPPFLPIIYKQTFLCGGGARIARKGDMWPNEWLAINEGGDLCEGGA